MNKFLRIYRSPEGVDGNGNPPPVPPAPPAGDPPPTPPEPPAPPAPQDWRSGIDPAIKDHPSLSKFKDPGSIAKSYLELEKKIGLKGIPVPGKDAKQEDFVAVMDQLGRPKDAAGYQLPQVQLPKGLSESEPLKNAFLARAHKNGLLPFQVADMYQWYNEATSIDYQNLVNERNDARAKAETALRTTWGKAYDANVALSSKVWEANADPEFKAFMDETGLGNDPRFMKFMVNMSKKLGGDSIGGDGGTSTKTPDEAVREINRIRMDKNHPLYEAHRNSQHPDHSHAVKIMTDLYEMAYPDERNKR